ncbi:MgtC/SapB family protein [Paroceanicella profunda]|uniref:Protein MgtC n=1 Tax=Paroceanicella profunda TaxID=2579971 RepID=A0A5B8FHR8_9RHOB|nr:MgtC/SapB family protein [Paroceanicella profunda]QDL92781.1 MgtC/SapB family protein [Paroceanicella profunda]
MEFETLAMLDRMETPLGTAVLRLFIAALLGGVIGIDREARQHSAGLRTHILICLAACLFTLISAELFARFADAGGNMDPTRVIEAVTAGVAFLAAGTIIRGEGGVKGLTTGAGMWLAGAIGCATGVGLYLLAVIATVLAVIVLSLVRLFER